MIKFAMGFMFGVWVGLMIGMIIFGITETGKRYAMNKIKQWRLTAQQGDQMRKKIEEIQQRYLWHYGIEEDSWWNCPKHPDGCIDDSKENKCGCNFQERIKNSTKDILTTLHSWLERKLKEQHKNPIGYEQFIRNLQKELK